MYMLQIRGILSHSCELYKKIKSTTDTCSEAAKEIIIK